MRRKLPIFCSFVLSIGFALASASSAWAQFAYSVNTSVVADTTTAVPGGTGHFTNFNPSDPIVPGDPMISGGNVVFWGEDTGRQGIYALRYGVLGKVADQNTLIPGGTGDFLSFAASPALSGGNALFLGHGGSGQQGIYLCHPGDPCQPGDPVKIVDLNTAIPGGTGSFIAIPTDPMISGQNVAFIGNGSGGQQGVYASFPQDPVRIADLNSAVPGGTGKFLAFGGSGTTPGAVISGTTVAFIGTSAGGGGIYVQIPQDPIRRAVDFNTAIPGGSGNFNRFWNLSLDGTNLAFVGGLENFDTGIIAEQGVYVGTPNATPQDPIKKVADLNTFAPGTEFRFTSFGNVAIDPAHVVFDAWYSPDGGTTQVHGLFTNLTGTLTKLFDNTGSIGGKPLSDFSFGVGGFSGTQVVYAASYTDGSQGIGESTVSGNRCPLSAGYWKNHPSAWPATSLILGDQSYTQSQLLTILGTSTTSDASLVLARNLIAAKLDLLNFSSPAPVSGTVATADGLLAQYAGLLPYKVGASSTAAKSMQKASTVLNNYDSDQLTRGCVQ